MLGGESQWTTQPGGDITRYDAITAAYAAHALVTDAIHEGRILANVLQFLGYAYISYLITRTVEDYNREASFNVLQ